MTRTLLLVVLLAGCGAETSAAHSEELGTRAGPALLSVAPARPAPDAGSVAPGDEDALPLPGRWAALAVEADADGVAQRVRGCVGGELVEAHRGPGGLELVARRPAPSTCTDAGEYVGGWFVVTREAPGGAGGATWCGVVAPGGAWWSAPAAPVAHLRCPRPGAWVDAAGRLVLATGAGSVRALAPDGTEAWASEVGRVFAGPVNLDGARLAVLREVDSAGKSTPFEAVHLSAATGEVLTREQLTHALPRPLRLGGAWLLAPDARSAGWANSRASGTGVDVRFTSCAASTCTDGPRLESANSHATGARFVGGAAVVELGGTWVARPQVDGAWATVDGWLPPTGALSSPLDAPDAPALFLEGPREAPTALVALGVRPADSRRVELHGGGVARDAAGRVWLASDGRLRNVPLMAGH